MNVVARNSGLLREVLAFWFGPAPHRSRSEWFRKDPSFDDAIRARFGAAVDDALGGACDDNPASAHDALARVILLDQFTRNIYRDTPRAFAGDARALDFATRAVAAKQDEELDRYERSFLYLPFEHSENATMQQRSVALFDALAAETGDDDTALWARKHAEIIRRFGRFPHRNEILGRASTPEEIAFLREPGSRF